MVGAQLRVGAHIAPSVTWRKNQWHLQHLDPVHKVDQHVRPIVEPALAKHSLSLAICQI